MRILQKTHLSTGRHEDHKKKYRILLADSDPAQRETYEAYLLEKGDFSDITIVSSGKDALDRICSSRFHLAILNISMPEYGGFAVIEEVIRRGIEPPYVIFLTERTDFAIKAFDLHALDYLLKPVSRQRFDEAIEWFKKIVSIEENYSPTPADNMLNITARGIHYHIKYDEIIYISSRAKKCIIHCTEFDIEIPRLIGEIEALLPRESFLRNHHQYVVNRKYLLILKSVDKRYYIGLKDQDDTLLPVGRRYVVSVKTVFGR